MICSGQQIPLLVSVWVCCNCLLELPLDICIIATNCETHTNWQLKYLLLPPMPSQLFERSLCMPLLYPGACSFWVVILTNPIKCFTDNTNWCASFLWMLFNESPHFFPIRNYVFINLGLMTLILLDSSATTLCTHWTWSKGQPSMLIVEWRTMHYYEIWE